MALAVLGALALTGITLWDRLGGSAGGNEPGPTSTRVNEPAPTQDNQAAPSQDNGAAPPQGDGPSPTKRSLELTPESGTMKTRITAIGTGFTPGATVDIEVHVEHADETVVGRDGTFRIPFTMPTSFGRYSGTKDWAVTATERDNPFNNATEYFTLSN